MSLVFLVMPLGGHWGEGLINLIFGNCTYLTAWEFSRELYLDQIFYSMRAL